MNNKGKTTIRSLNESDITEVKKVEQESFFEVSDMIDSPDYEYGIFVGNSLVGFCTIGGADVIDDIEAVAAYPGFNGDSLLLSDVFVLPEHRAKGYGSSLVREAIKMKWASEKKNELVFIESWDDEVKRFYDKLGFSSITDDIMVLKPSALISIKPKTETVSAPEYIQDLINVNLKKDLYDNEEICSYCHGTGLIIRDNEYGLSDAPNKSYTNLFPYKHQSLSFCPHCNNGVVRRCKFCGQIMSRTAFVHDCEQQDKIRQAEREQKLKDLMDNAQVAPKEVEDSCECFYSEYYSWNEGYFTDWDEFFDDWHENHNEEDDKPEYVWTTERVDMHIDADDIIANATENLYEDAMDDISEEKCKELQNMLDKWCDTCGVRETYVKSNKYKVKIPWENY